MIVNNKWNWMAAIFSIIIIRNLIQMLAHRNIKRTSHRVHREIKEHKRKLQHSQQSTRMQLYSYIYIACLVLTGLYIRYGIQLLWTDLHHIAITLQLILNLVVVILVCMTSKNKQCPNSLVPIFMQTSPRLTNGLPSIHISMEWCN